jgi:hypothetical protein
MKSESEQDIFQCDGVAPWIWGVWRTRECQNGVHGPPDRYGFACDKAEALLEASQCAVHMLKQSNVDLHGRVWPSYQTATEGSEACFCGNRASAIRKLSE